jgi:hypothetical protein
MAKNLTAGDSCDRFPGDMRQLIREQVRSRNTEGVHGGSHLSDHRAVGASTSPEDREALNRFMDLSSGNNPCSLM